MSDPAPTLARWKGLAGDDSPAPWTTPDHLIGFFQRFRPHGEGLDRVFEGVVGADEIVPRLLEIYRATASGWPEDDEEFDAYFNVESPPPLATDAAVDLALRHLAKVGEMARGLGRDHLVDVLSTHATVEVVEAPLPMPPVGGDVESMIEKTIADYMLMLTPRESEAAWLDRAFWSIGCDPNLRHFVLWPLYRASSRIEEPFRPYFDLWAHGAACRFGDDAAVRVYLPIPGQPSQAGA